jgi:hypothetical protein
MFVTRYNPHRQVREFRRGMNLLNSLLDEEYTNDIKSDFSPSINTREGEFAYHIEVDLPGIKKKM